MFDKDKQKIIEILKKQIIKNKNKKYLEKEIKSLKKIIYLLQN